MKLHHKSRNVFMISIISLLCWSSYAQAERTVYVDSMANVNGVGTQDDPFKTVAAALALTDGDLTILVAGGTYVGEPNNTTVRSRQTVIGGYDRAFTTSDPTVTPTIIDMSRSYEEQHGTYNINGATGWTLMNLTIANSTSGHHGDTDHGGAIYIRGGSNGTLRGVTFFNCRAQYEGANENGAARGGGAVCIRSASTALFEDCVFDSCTAASRGGAVYCRSGGSGNIVTFNRCLFTNCSSVGGASTIDDGEISSEIEITNCVFLNNGYDMAVPSGSAPSRHELRISDERALIYNCTFIGSNNPSGYMIDLGDSGNEAGLKNIVNCIFTDNTIAETENHFRIFRYVDDYNDVITLQNNLFGSNSGLEPLDRAGQSIIDVNALLLIDANGDVVSEGEKASLFDISGNIAGEPLFFDAQNNDYHLLAGSPGEDAGQTTSLVLDDFQGTARPMGLAYDIGAFEGSGLAGTSYAIDAIVATASSSLNADSGPEKTVDESGLDALGQHDTAIANMWISRAAQGSPVWIEYAFDRIYKMDQMEIWNSNNDLEWLFGWGIKTASIETSTDGITWTALSNVQEFAQATGSSDYLANTTIDFNGASAQYVRITCTSTWGGGDQCGLSEVQFSYLPVTATSPNPVDGALDVSANCPLSWTTGLEADSHEVHLGTDMQAVSESTAATAVVNDTTYTADLQMETTYYWKVVEVNETETPTAWSSPVWSFTTSSQIVVDDFEDYTQLSPHQLYQIWTDSLGFPADDYFPDGYAGNGTGAIVGNDPSEGPIVEYTIVHGGFRAMPLYYDGPSETTRNFDSPQDWTLHGITTLVVHFYGTDGNDGELYLKIGNHKISYPGSDSDLATEAWTTWEIDLPSSGASLSNVSSITLGIEGNKAEGQLYFDDILLK